MTYPKKKIKKEVKKIKKRYMGPKKEPEPEPFCNKCAQQHIRHNLCRNHEICDDIEELHDKKVAIKQKYL